MSHVLVFPPVFHGGDDDLNHALAHLSWKEMVMMALVLLTIFLLILLLAVMMQ